MFEMKKVKIGLAIILIIVFLIVCYFWRVSYISYKEINLAMNDHHFHDQIQTEENHYDIKQYGYFKDVRYKDEPHYIYTYYIKEYPTLKDVMNPAYNYKKSNVETMVKDEKKNRDLSNSKKAKYQINNE